MCSLDFGRPRESDSLFTLLLLFLASNFAFLMGFPVKTSFCMQHISERQTQTLKSHGLWRSHMLYASSGVNNLHLLELAKWVQLLPAPGPDSLCGNSEETQSQRPLQKNISKKDKHFWKSMGNEEFPTKKKKKNQGYLSRSFYLVTLQIIQWVTSSGSFIVITILDFFF